MRNYFDSRNLAPQNQIGMARFLFAAIFVFAGCLALQAQEKWGLERCVVEALKNNIAIQQAYLNQSEIALGGKELRFRRIPSLNATSNFGLSFGRVVNPATNDFETENSYYQSIGANSGVLIFNGFRFRNSIRQNALHGQAAAADIEQAKNDLALNVALAYLNVLFAYENLNVAQRRVELTQVQLDNIDKMIAAGSRPEVDRYDIVAQIAQDEQAVIDAQNNIEFNILSLKQYMMLEPDYPLDIEVPPIDISRLEALENSTFEAVYTAALGSQPQIVAADLRKRASEVGISIARALSYPSLTVGANIGTNWSDLARMPGNYTPVRVAQPGVYINGEQALFEVESSIPTSFVITPYGTQLSNNLGFGFGATLSIPIFNQYSNKASVERAKIDVVRTSLQSEQTRQTLKTNVQNALAAARAARKTLEGAEASAQAAKFALQSAERKVDLGSINTYEYLIARNRSDSAETNYLIARYDYFFKIKVLEYYMGRGLRL